MVQARQANVEVRTMNTPYVSFTEEEYEAIVEVLRITNISEMPNGRVALLPKKLQESILGGVDLESRVADYFWELTLGELTDEQQQFLLRTSDTPQQWARRELGMRSSQAEPLDLPPELMEEAARMLFEMKESHIKQMTWTDFNEARECFGLKPLESKQ